MPIASGDHEGISLPRLVPRALGMAAPNLGDFDRSNRPLESYNSQDYSFSQPEGRKKNRCFRCLASPESPSVGVNRGVVFNYRGETK